MSAPISSFPFVPKTPPITLAAAAEVAAAGGGKRGRSALSRKDAQQLAKKSRRLADEFRDSMEKVVKKKLDRMSGPDNNRKVGLKVAQFIPGKGLEVAGAQLSKDDSIYCSLGLKGVKPVDCFDKLFECVKGRQISQDFAFKLICDPDLSGRIKNSRAVAFNCYRHVNPDSYNYLKTGWFDYADTDAKRESNRQWHSSLGPDASHIRRSVMGITATSVDAGTWRGNDNSPTFDDSGGMARTWVPPSGETPGYYSAAIGDAAKSNSLMSPFRYPYHKEFMYSRLNRQVLENYGFSLNPFKIQSEYDQASWLDPNDSSAGLLFEPRKFAMYAYGNPGTWLMNFGEQKSLNSADQHYLASSFPAKINNQSPPSTDFVNNAPEWEYHSQFGPGKLNYQFQNDGSNPVCIDICVIGVKKSETTALDGFLNISQYNYNLDKYANYKQLNVGGYDARDVDEPKVIDVDLANDEWISDAKLPFIPSQCFKNPQSYNAAVGSIHNNSGNPNIGVAAQEVFSYLQQGKKNPFKLIKRDQFIVSSGASRAWNTTLPGFKYRPTLYDDVEYPLEPGVDTVGKDHWDASKVRTTGDEYTFMLAIGASGIAVPVEEIYSSTSLDVDGTVPDDFDVRKKAIMDRQPSSCNVSVVGTYTETVHPSFVERIGSTNFINGRMIEPYFTSTGSLTKIPDNNNVQLDNRLATVNINTQAQTVRVTNDGISGVGAISTQVGA